jgi:RNA polymerase sigma factor (sigma-70 family)
MADVSEAGTPSDSTVIQRCLQGDTGAFRLLYRRHHQRVRSILARLAPISMLDDLVQEVFVRAWQGLPKLRHPHQFATWLYRIAWNVAADARHRAAQHQTHWQDCPPEQLDQLVSPNHPMSGLVQLHYQDLVSRGLAHLSFEQRTVLVLHDLEAMPQKQISDILEIPIGTVKSRLFHARATLRQFFHQAGLQL